MPLRHLLQQLVIWLVPGAICGAGLLLARALMTRRTPNHRRQSVIAALLAVLLGAVGIGVVLLFPLYVFDGLDSKFREVPVLAFFSFYWPSWCLIVSPGFALGLSLAPLCRLSRGESRVFYAAFAALAVALVAVGVATDFPASYGEIALTQIVLLVLGSVVAFLLRMRHKAGTA